MINVVKKPFIVNLGPDAGKTAYYAAFSRKGTANSIDIAQQMKEGSSAFTLGEVVGITLDLPARIKAALLNGQAVRIDGLGTFKPALSTAVQSTKEALKASHVTIKSLNFVPDPELIATLNAKAQFEWIEPSKAAAEDDDTPTPEGSSEGSTTNGSTTGTTPPPNPDVTIDGDMAII